MTITQDGVHKHQAEHTAPCITGHDASMRSAARCPVSLSAKNERMFSHIPPYGSIDRSPDMVSSMRAMAVLLFAFTMAEDVIGLYIGHITSSVEAWYTVVQEFIMN